MIKAIPQRKWRYEEVWTVKCEELHNKLHVIMNKLYQKINWVKINQFCRNQAYKTKQVKQSFYLHVYAYRFFNKVFAHLRFHTLKNLKINCFNSLSNSRINNHQNINAIWCYQYQYVPYPHSLRHLIIIQFSLARCVPPTRDKRSPPLSWTYIVHLHFV